LGNLKPLKGFGAEPLILLIVFQNGTFIRE